MPWTLQPRTLGAVLALGLTIAVALGITNVSFGQSAADGALVLDVLTFNAALLPVVAAETRQAERAGRMAQHLVGYDVLVLQEVFVNSWREALLDELADAYPYRGDLVGSDGARMMPWRQGTQRLSIFIANLAMTRWSCFGIRLVRACRWMQPA